MKREQGIWLGGGLAVGFVAGFLVAYVMTVDTTVGGPAPVASSGPAAAGKSAPTADPHVDVRDMLADLNRRLEADPEDVRILAQLAEIYMQAGKPDKALGFLDRIDAVEPGRFQTGLMRAMALETLGREDEFADLVSHMATTFADRWESHYLLAAHLLSHHHEEGDLARARQALDRVDDLQPGIPEAAELRLQLESAEGKHGVGNDRSG
jgi:tetratricopeptide (TPR) repeat protein